MRLRRGRAEVLVRQDVAIDAELDFALVGYGRAAARHCGRVDRRHVCGHHVGRKNGVSADNVSALRRRGRAGLG